MGFGRINKVLRILTVRIQQGKNYPGWGSPIKNLCFILIIVHSLYLEYRFPSSSEWSYLCSPTLPARIWCYTYHR